MTVDPGGLREPQQEDSNSTLAADTALLEPFYLGMVRVALVLGWVSAIVVAAGTVLPHLHHRHMFHGPILALAVAAAAGNSVLALLPWRRWLGTRRAAGVLTAWASAVVAVVTGLVYAGGGWASDFYLLYFLVIPFLAATEPVRRQRVLYAFILAGYLAAVLAVPGPSPAGLVVVRLSVLAAACAVGAFLARAVHRTTAARARAEETARMERLLATEAHHRIKNNLQLVADLLILEADRAHADPSAVVEETLSRIQSVAAVHQSLAQRSAGRVALRPVIERIAGLVGERLGRVVRVAGDDVTLNGRAATWTALVANELVVNALRHGEGEVTVTLALGPAGDHAELAVEDGGPGPTGANPGLGLSLVRRLVEEGLTGVMTSGMDGGRYRVEIQFPIAEEETYAGAHR
ncbi:MAG: two-component system, sensor histidine kinase PdtaS [Actinomycetota bacterium]|nr:two-component system, sensor histidine kinase PdtaS [Actinomycetota bacterium]